jgi:septum site-determining protein MinD
MVRREQMLSMADVVEILAVDLIGVVPEDKGIIVSTNRGMPVVLDGKTPAGQAYRNIAGRLLGQEIPFMALRESSGVWDQLARWFRGS